MDERYGGRAARVAGAAGRWVSAAVLLGAFGAATAQGLTEAEQQWLALSEPVLKFALQQRLPLDVVVQPEARAGDPPLGMAYVDGRCKLVLSLRGNPGADDSLAQAAPALRPVLVETMAAHEIGHCWRHVRGQWAPAAGAQPAAAFAQDGAAARLQVRAEQLEEGFGDLVGLSWVQEHHPRRYAEVFAWLSSLRDPPPYPGSPHDTRAWLRLARDPGAHAGGLFERAHAGWLEGAAQGEPDRLAQGEPAPPPR